jgi:hypothetical protein
VRILLTVVIALIAVGVVFVGATSSFAAVPQYYNAGIVTANNVSISKTINMQSEKEIAIILKKQSGNFNNQLLNVSVSADNSTFYKVDSVQAGTSNIKVLEYSDANKGATLAINPTIFPFLKIDFPKIVNSNHVLTWSSVRG